MTVPMGAAPEARFYLDGASSLDVPGPGPFGSEALGWGGETIALVTSASRGPGSELPTFTDQEIADYLRTGFWTDFDSAPHQFNLEPTGINAKNGIIRVKFDGWAQDADGVTDEGKALAWYALQLYANVLNMEFVEVAGEGQAADIYFGDAEPGAYANSYYNAATGNISYSWVNVSSSWISTYGAGIGSYSLQVYIHEIGHALGLGHAGRYDGSATYITDTSQASSNNNVYLNDSWQKSVMSYMDQRENTTLDASYARLLTPMIADWIALDDMPSYAITNAYSGDTTYGFNTTITVEQSAVWNALADRANRNAFHIIDSDGNDTVDFSGYGSDQRIDLAGGGVSDIGGLTGNMTISTATVIENAVGGAGDDTLLGNAAGNLLVGNDGSDTLLGFDGADTLFGGAGADTLDGGADDDEIHGGGGDDQVHGGAGRDTLHSAGEGSYFGDEDDDVIFAGPTAEGQSEMLDGGDGVDLLDTSEFAGDYVINLATGETNFATERFLAFEQLRAGAGADTVTGTAADNTIWGGGGDDWIKGDGGNDGLFGNGGADTLLGDDGDDYLAGNAGDDTIYGGAGFDRAYGGAGADILHSGGAGRYSGGGGDDVIHAGQTDALDTETLLGGAGIDRLHVETHVGDYEIDLETGQTNFANELFAGFEDLHSGAGNDRLKGTAGANRIWGNGGNDTIEGGDGADLLDGGDGDDDLRGGAGGDLLLGGSGADLLDGGDGADILHGGEGDDTIHAGGLDIAYGGDGNDTILSGGDCTVYGDHGDDTLHADAAAGRETLDGGAGEDWLDTTRAAVDYVIDLGAAGSQSGFADEDFRGFEHVITGAGADRILGSDLRNEIFAGAGNDVIEGGKGWDRLHGDDGSDEIYGGAGGDRLWGGEGDDHLDAGPGADRLYGGNGNDTYRVHETRQRVVETADGGRDLVLSSADYDLSAQGLWIEDLTLVTDASIDGTGNAADNVIIGNDGANRLAGLGGDDLLRGGKGNDTLDGGIGDDVMRGWQGDDTYVVDSLGDRVIEGKTQGAMDAIHATISVDLQLVARHVEALVLFGSADIDGHGTNRGNALTGNSGNNLIDGRSGKDLIAAGAGEDILTGGRAADTFILNAGDGADTITDLNLARDTILFESGAAGFADLAITQEGRHTRVGYGAGDSVLLLAIDANALTEEVFVF